jgi:hypothetical protein
MKMNRYHINFKDKRRLQRGMMAETEQEVREYITNKYKLSPDDFEVVEVEKG